MNELLAIQAFSVVGTDTRFEYITLASGARKIKFFGTSTGIDVPTDLARWFIGFIEYDTNECMIRLRRKGIAAKWDDRASLFV